MRPVPIPQEIADHMNGQLVDIHPPEEDTDKFFDVVGAVLNDQGLWYAIQLEEGDLEHLQKNGMFLMHLVTTSPPPIDFITGSDLERNNSV